MSKDLLVVHSKFFMMAKFYCMRQRMQGGTFQGELFISCIKSNVWSYKRGAEDQNIVLNKAEELLIW